MINNTVLHIDSICAGYNGIALLQEVSSDVQRGEFIVLMGANGSGKSTLLKTIIGELPLLSGEVLLLGKKISAYSAQEKAQTISIVTTERNFNPYLTVEDVLALGRIPYLNLFAQLQEGDNRIIEDYVSLLGIENWLQKKFNQLSDGQKQKVLIARAFIQDADLILLDEPTAHLDVKNRVEVFSLLQKLSKEKNKAIICATHEINIALDYSDRTWMIDKHSNFIDDLTSKFNQDIVYCNLF